MTTKMNIIFQNTANSENICLLNSTCIFQIIDYVACFMLGIRTQIQPVQISNTGRHTLTTLRYLKSSMKANYK